jgi:glucose-6-phosphate isomerase
MQNITKSPLWQALNAHQLVMKETHLRDFFAQEPDRFNQFSIEVGDLLLDYSRNRITRETMTLLMSLAEASQLSPKIHALFSGFPINLTEGRAALHSALRAPVDMQNTHINQLIKDEITQARAKMRDLVEHIHAQKRKGVTGKPIKHIVNIGIGGSHHGPQMGVHALKDFAVTDLKFHFVSTVDHAHVQDVIEQIDAESTLLIISSKSFTTIETLTNARTLIDWLQAKVGGDCLKQQVIAVTAVKQKALDFGIAEENIFPLWDFIGGRFSIWSAIGLPLYLMLGHTQFDAFLQGAYEMDEHFKTASFDKNLPVILALLSIWNINFFGATAEAIVPYSYRLRYLIPYLQQAQMESLGKRVTLDGQTVNYMTGPVVFGEEGCNGQHTYHQLLHQGMPFIPVDFVLIGHDDNNIHHDVLLASALSQAQALMRGKTEDEAYAELCAKNVAEEDAKLLAHHQVIPGNRSSNIIFLNRLTPKNLGALLALYEHKIFTQAAILNINPFDQWGVELGKQLLPTIQKQLHTNTINSRLDAATTGIIQHYRNKQGKK